MLNPMTTYLKRASQIALLCCFGAVSQTALASGGKPADTYTKTQHPIVMVNGIFGFDKALGVMDYWYGITNKLSDGGAKVYVANLQASGSLEYRGEELLAYIEQLKAQHGHSKFNLIGHSYGGPAIRYVHGVRPDLVASVMSMGSPHKGTDLAEGLLDIAAMPVISDVVFGLGDLGATVIDGISGHETPNNQNTRILATEMSRARMAAWNQEFPAGIPTSACGQGQEVVGNTRFYSMSGVAQGTNALDIIGDGIVAVTSLFFDNNDHDGLVNRCSSHLGKVVRDDYNLNHVDQINHILGLRASNSPEPSSIYRSHANRLKQAGL